MTLIPGIKQISQVGNDMYAQGAITIAGIGTTNVDYLADPADTRLLAGRDPVLEEISVGMSGVETDQKYATGAQPLTVTDAMLGNLTYCQVQFSPKQDLNGYANPWPAGGGSNLISYDSSTWEQGAIVSGGSYNDNPNRIRQKTKWTVKPNTKYTISVVGDLVPAFHLWTAELSYISDSTWLAPLPFTFETPSNAYYIQFTCRNRTNSIMSPSEMGNTLFIQFQEGETATTMSPYSNICPITGTDTVNVYVAESYDLAAAPKATVSLGAERFGGTAELVSGNGLETWTANASYSIVSVGTSSQGVAYAKITAPNAKNNGIVIAECYKNTNDAATNNACRLVGGALYVYDNRFTDIATATALLSGVVLYYEVSTVAPFTFSGANDITLQDGTNTIWTDTNGPDISVTYVTKK